jgi:hypothetical protein
MKKLILLYLSDAAPVGSALKQKRLDKVFSPLSKISMKPKRSAMLLLSPFSLPRVFLRHNDSEPRTGALNHSVVYEVLLGFVEDL